MWKVTQLHIGPLEIAFGTNPRGWPFALVIVWTRPDKPPMLLVNLGTNP